MLPIMETLQKGTQGRHPLAFGQYASHYAGCLRTRTLVFLDNGGIP